MGPRVLLASAELDPFVKVGGLGEATAGLARMLRSQGHAVDVVIPDYPVTIDHAEAWPLSLPDWVGEGWVRSASVPGIGTVHAVWFPGIDRPHPYVDPRTSEGWADNDHRFYGFGAAVAALARRLGVDVVHLNDWHTASAVAWFPPERTVLTIHNLAHQGDADIGWLSVLGDRAGVFEHLGRANPLVAAVRTVDRIVTVSPGYAREILSREYGCGLEGELAARGDRLMGIRNGLDPSQWGPPTDPHLPDAYGWPDLDGKLRCRSHLHRELGMDDPVGPTIGMVSRFADQKGIDMAIQLIDFLPSMPASLILHGTGDARLVEHAQRAAAGNPHVRVVHGFDERLAHLVVAGSDLCFVPSRFEPCGLTQMQAMTCGTIPVVTNVGGLADTVVDTDAHPTLGTGFVAGQPSVPALLDAMHRAVRGWRNHRRRRAIQRRGMTADWTWQQPARRYESIYAEVAAA